MSPSCQHHSDGGMGAVWHQSCVGLERGCPRVIAEQGSSTGHAELLLTRDSHGGRLPAICKD